MKQCILTAAILFIFSSAQAQFVAKVLMEQEIPGLCSQEDVYTLFPHFEGQQDAVCTVSNEDILKKLSNEIQFVKDNPKYKDSGLVGLYINCEGNVLKCELDRKTRSPELDQQILDLFATLTGWKPGTLNGEAVDTYKLFGFSIYRGVFYKE